MLSGTSQHPRPTPNKAPLTFYYYCHNFLWCVKQFKMLFLFFEEGALVREVLLLLLIRILWLMKNKYKYICDVAVCVCVFEGLFANIVGGQLEGRLFGWLCVATINSFE